MNAQPLVLGSQGDTVKALQALLKRYDSGLAVSGRFDERTERALRWAQWRLGLFPPDGVATLAVLGTIAKAAVPAGSNPAAWMQGMVSQNSLTAATGQQIGTWLLSPAAPPPAIPKSLIGPITPWIRRAQSANLPQDLVKNPATLGMSPPGLHFVFYNETGGTDGSATAHLHWPGGASGVTIGPGYDMGTRTEEDVRNDLMGISVPQDTAAAAAKGVNKFHAAAKKFCDDNANLLNLSIEQQLQLQGLYKTSYESMVQTRIRIPLHQYEFDALASYAGNPGRLRVGGSWVYGWPRVVSLVNQRKMVDAMAEIERYTGASDVRRGLTRRRGNEAKLFLYADYGPWK